jgi:hypothetical protein
MSLDMFPPTVTDRQIPPVDRQPDFTGCGLHHLGTLGHDIQPDVVAQQDSHVQNGPACNGEPVPFRIFRGSTMKVNRFPIK